MESQEFMVYNYVNFIILIYDKDKQFNYSKLNDFYINTLWLIYIFIL